MLRLYHNENNTVMRLFPIKRMTTELRL